MKFKKLLAGTFYIDFAITFGFGLVSWLYPHSTYGTILALDEFGSSLTLAILSSFSVFYMLTGLTCLAAARIPPPYSLWIGAIMGIRHAWVGIVGIQDAGQDWIIGNPWYDVVIHSLFFVFYLLAIFFIATKNK